MPTAAVRVVRRHPAISSIAALACSAAVTTAQAAVIVTATITFPSSLTPGQTDVPASIEISNQNSGVETSLTDTVTSITLVPSCALAAPGGCAAGSTDPGVFMASAFGTGDPGTACGGTTFTISEVDAASGKLSFGPSTPVTLVGAGTSCRISFTLDVLKLPAKDAAPGIPSIQTLQILDVTAGSGGSTSSPRATSTTTVQLSQQTCADIDGDGSQGALSDGLIFIRALFGLTGAAVVSSATNPSSTRTTWEQVRAHMNAHCGTNFTP